MVETYRRMLGPDGRFPETYIDHLENGRSGVIGGEAAVIVKHSLAYLWEQARFTARGDKSDEMISNGTMVVLRNRDNEGCPTLYEADSSVASNMKVGEYERGLPVGLD